MVLKRRKITWAENRCIVNEEEASLLCSDMSKEDGKRVSKSGGKCDSV